MAAIFRTACYLMFGLGLALGSSNDKCGSQITNKGREFLLLLPQNARGLNSTILVGAESPGHVEIRSPRLPGTPFTYPVSRGVTEILPDRFLAIANGTVVTKKGIRLLADTDIVVTAFIEIGNSYFRVSVPPVTAFSTEYAIATFNNNYTEFAVVGASNDTNVFIKLPNNSIGDMHIRLDQYEASQFTAHSNLNLRGTWVKSSKPVYVSAGSGRPDALDEFLLFPMLPTKSWSDTFIVPPIRDANFVMVLHDIVDTTVEFYNFSSTHTETLTAMNSTTLAFRSDPLVVTANRPVMVTHFTDSSVDMQVFNVIPGLRQYLHSYMFVAPSPRFGVPHTLTIVVPIVAEASLLLDGQPINVTDRSPVPAPLGNYTLIETTVEAGLHELYSQDGSKFGAFLYMHSAVLSGGPVGMAYGTIECSGTSLVPAKQCFSCDDMTSLLLCDHVEQCRQDQVCFVERYSLHSAEQRYRSGCLEKTLCSNRTLNRTGTCLECCSGDYCNLNGCGDGAPPRNQRGPYCYDCFHVSNTSQCRQATLCQPDQLCEIEQYSWGGMAYNYIMGCQSATHCSTGKRDVEGELKRATPVCRQCCKDDFCNRKCTASLQPPIIG